MRQLVWLAAAIAATGAVVGCSDRGLPKASTIAPTIDTRPKIRAGTRSDLVFVYQGFYPAHGVVVGYGSFLSPRASWIVADPNMRVIRCIDLPGRRPASGAREMEQVAVDLSPAQVEEVRSIIENARTGTFLAMRTKPQVMDGTIRNVAVIEGDRVLIGSDNAYFYALPDIAAQVEQIRDATCAGKPPVRSAVPIADLRGANLDGQSATDLDLTAGCFDKARMGNARFDRTVLRGASLRGVVGPDASFAGAVLDGAALDGASLPGANFRGAKLIDATLTGAHLVGADLSGADLGGADLTRADIRGANLKDAIFDCGTRLPRGQTPQRLEMVPVESAAPPCR